MLKKALFWASTIVLTLIMLFSIYNYFFNHEAIVGFFEHFGYPAYLVYPLAVAKILGLIAVWGNFSNWLKEWAYAGFFFNTLLAFFAHYITDGAGVILSATAFVCVLLSYFTEKQLRP